MKKIKIKDMDVDQEVMLSVSGYNWKIKTVSNNRVIAIQQKTNISEILARILSSKNIDIEDIEDYLNPTIKRFLPDPKEFLDMEKAASAIADSIIEDEKIVIFGDYDVDGATSSALFKRFFDSLSANSSIFIPDRINDGYGPNPSIFQRLKDDNTDLVITVDCGTTSFDALNVADDIDLKVIIVDHHLSAETLPKALAIVNPNRIDEQTIYKNLAAVGVCFLVIVAVTSVLKERKYFTDKKPPNLLNLLDLVAVGTICDVVALEGINRAFVVQGLKILAKRSNIGLSSLIDISRVNETPTAYHLGYILGPRINAGGRVGKSSHGAELLSTDDIDIATNLALELDQFNMERRAIENIIFDEAIIIAENNNDNSMQFIIGKNWHPGVIGIIASRLKEKYNKPIIVITLINGMGKASCRSISGIDLGAIIVNAKLLNLIESGGGHAMAAGFTVREENLENLKQYLNKILDAKLAVLTEKDQRYFDSYLDIEGLSILLAKEIESLGPFGSNNTEPRFLLSDINISGANIVGNNHITCFIKSRSNPSKSFKAIAFKAVGTPLEEELLKFPQQFISLIINIKINHWKGNERLELNIIDLVKKEYLT